VSKVRIKVELSSFFSFFPSFACAEGDFSIFGLKGIGFIMGKYEIDMKKKRQNMTLLSNYYSSKISQMLFFYFAIKSIQFKIELTTQV